MKLAIMQPYLFPYIGYFQLIKAVDRFVIYDNVQYIKGGWINRNRILDAGKDRFFTFSLRRASTYAPINARFFSQDFGRQRANFLKTLSVYYRKAPFCAETRAIIERALDFDLTQNISVNITMSLKAISSHLGIRTEFLAASATKKDTSLRPVPRLIEINKKMGSTEYINPIGGHHLYSRDEFAKEGIALRFLKTRPIVYPQCGETAFVPNLSIVDVLMNNSLETVRNLLDLYDLV